MGTRFSKTVRAAVVVVQADWFLRDDPWKSITDWTDEEHDDFRWSQFLLRSSIPDHAGYILH